MMRSSKKSLEDLVVEEPFHDASERVKRNVYSKRCGINDLINRYARLVCEHNEILIEGGQTCYHEPQACPPHNVALKRFVHFQGAFCEHLLHDEVNVTLDTRHSAR